MTWFFFGHKMLLMLTVVINIYLHKNWLDCNTCMYNSQGNEDQFKHVIENKSIISNLYLLFKGDKYIF